MDEPSPIQTRVPVDVKKKIDKAASAEGLSVAAYVRRLLLQHAKEIK
jgi:uncharacterized protein (DUF1778 family)